MSNNFTSETTIQQLKRTGTSPLMQVQVHSQVDLYLYFVLGKYKKHKYIYILASWLWHKKPSVVSFLVFQTKDGSDACSYVNCVAPHIVTVDTSLTNPKFASGG